MCVRIDNSRNLCQSQCQIYVNIYVNQYVPCSVGNDKLHAQHTSLIKMVAIYGKQLQRPNDFSRKESYPDQQKGIEDYDNTCRNEKGSKFRKRLLQSFKKAIKERGTFAQISFLRFADQINSFRIVLSNLLLH